MKKSKSDIRFDIINIALTALITLITLYPLYFIVIASFSDPYAVSKGKVLLYPVDFTLEAYGNMFKHSEIWTGYRNSIFYTTLGTLYNLLLTIPAAYVLSKKWLPLRGAISWFFFITMYFGGGMIPTYLLVKNLGLLNTPWVLIIGSGVSCYNLIVTRQFFTSTIPDELYEAAKIDGSSEIGAFFKIALPLSAPIVAVMALYYGVGHWNSYYSALIYVTNKDYHPLQLVLRRILIQNETLETAISSGELGDDAIQELARRAYMANAMKYALIFIASAPMLIIYPFIQKYFVKGVMIGSVKG